MKILGIFDVSFSWFIWKFCQTIMVWPFWMPKNDLIWPFKGSPSLKNDFWLRHQLISFRFLESEDNLFRGWKYNEFHPRSWFAIFIIAIIPIFRGWEYSRNPKIQFSQNKSPTEFIVVSHRERSSDNDL